MPYVKKSEYESLKSANRNYSAMAAERDRLGGENVVFRGEIEALRRKVNRLSESDALRKEAYNLLQKACGLLDWEAKRWKRYYEAAIKTFKITEYVEMPGCFNPMESIEYVVKLQESGQEKDNAGI